MGVPVALPDTVEERELERDTVEEREVERDTVEVRLLERLGSAP